MTTTKDEMFENQVMLKCLALSNDPEYKKQIKNMTHTERIEFLSTNGMTPVVNPFTDAMYKSPFTEIAKFSKKGNNK